LAGLILTVMPAVVVVDGIVVVGAIVVGVVVVIAAAAVVVVIAVVFAIVAVVVVVFIVVVVAVVFSTSKALLVESDAFVALAVLSLFFELAVMDVLEDILLVVPACPWEDVAYVVLDSVPFAFVEDTLFAVRGPSLAVELVGSSEYCLLEYVAFEPDVVDPVCTKKKQYLGGIQFL
jgi:hypothetical protein